jgi:hypothetical protein
VYMCVCVFLLYIFSETISASDAYVFSI